MNIRYKARALRHLEQIHGHIAKDDPAAASRTVAQIVRSIERLSRFPWSARPGVVAGTRILVVPGLPYVAIYRVRGEFVDVVAILHTARRRRS
jgi:plasmid stabilization system protein ParE